MPSAGHTNSAIGGHHQNKVLAAATAVAAAAAAVVYALQWAMDVIIGRTCQSSLIFMVGSARSIGCIPLLVLVNGLPGAMNLAHGRNVNFSVQQLCG
jgi:hypothetical protein